MEYILYDKQYIGKAGISFNIRLNRHRKDVKNRNVILIKAVIISIDTQNSLELIN